MAIINRLISNATTASGIIVLLKNPTKYREFFPTLFVKTTDFQLVFNFEQTCTVTTFGEHGIIAKHLLMTIIIIIIIIVVVVVIKVSNIRITILYL